MKNALLASLIMGFIVVGDSFATLVNPFTVEEFENSVEFRASNPGSGELSVAPRAVPVNTTLASLRAAPDTLDSMDPNQFLIRVYFGRVINENNPLPNGINLDFFAMSETHISSGISAADADTVLLPDSFLTVQESFATNLAGQDIDVLAAIILADDPNFIPILNTLVLGEHPTVAITAGGGLGADEPIDQALTLVNPGAGSSIYQGTLSQGTQIASRAVTFVELAQVPEPASLISMVVGCGLLLKRRRSA